MTSVDSARARVSAALGLERNIVAVSVAMFLLALGENLWKRFLPKYLEILGAPIAAAPTLGGLGIAAYGVRDGVHLGLGVTVVLAAVALAALARIDIPVRADPVPTHILGVWRSLPPPLRWLLTSDIFIRTCEGLVDVFLVLYAINVIGVSAPAYGILVAVQMTTAILSYLPAAKLTNRFGRKPFVIATFVAFSLFPIAVVLAG